MAPDDRDRSFDKALARHLRVDDPSLADANSPSREFGRGGKCPDPETLAAYHERSLLPQEMNSWKEHIVGCANCQTVLAHLEATDEIPLRAAEEERVFAENEAARPVSAASQSTPASPASLPKKSRRARLLRGARWPWLAPAGALAAGLLVWIALHENEPLPLPTLRQSESKVAQNRVPPAPLPPVSTGVPQASPSPKSAPALTTPQSRVGEYAISNGRAAQGAIKQREKLSDEAQFHRREPLGGKELHARKDGARDASADQLTAANQLDLEDKNLPEALRKKEEAPSQDAKVQTQTAQMQNAQTQNQYNYAPQKVPGPAPMNQTETMKRAKGTAAAKPAPAPPPSAPGAAGGIASSYDSSASLEVANVISNPRLISPPGANVIWRAGRGGLIELSKDGGSSWSRQTSGLLADLLTGSAPSDQVCWIVGRVGAILLTTDGGAHWKIIRPPFTEDLGGVRASNALQATIWNARMTKNFQTSDGGLTWTPVPSP